MEKDEVWVRAAEEDRARVPGAADVWAAPRPRGLAATASAPNADRQSPTSAEYRAPGACAPSAGLI